MTEPLRIWDAKNLQWINEPHVPVARNPNPVAPKTDTPATQIPDDLKTLYGNAQAFRHAFGSGRFVGAGTVEVLIERIANLESTLAAERASRVQAEGALRELDALWDFSEPITSMTAITYDDPSAINAAMAKARTLLSKPSVSPEQAEGI